MLDSGSWGHIVLQTPALVSPFLVQFLSILFVLFVFVYCSMMSFRVTGTAVFRGFGEYSHTCIIHRIMSVLQLILV